MPGAVEFLASYFVGRQLGAQQNVDTSTANRLGVTQAMLGLTPVSVILVNEIAKREAQPDGATASGAGDDTLSVPLSAFGTRDAKGAATGATGATATTSPPTPSAGSAGSGGTPRAVVEREVPIGRLEDLVQAGQGAFGAMKEAFVALREEARVAQSMLREAGRSTRDAARAEEGTRAEERADRGVAAPPGAGPASKSREHPSRSGD